MSGLLSLRDALSRPAVDESSQLIPLRTAITSPPSAPQRSVVSPPVVSGPSDLDLTRQTLGETTGAVNLASGVLPKDWRADIAPLIGAGQIATGALGAYQAATGPGSTAKKALGVAGGGLGVVSGASKIPALASSVPGLATAGSATIGGVTGATGLVGAVPVVPAVGTALGIASEAMSNEPDYEKAVKSGLKVAGLALAAPSGGISLLAEPVAEFAVGRTLEALPRKDIPDIVKALMMADPIFVGTPLSFFLGQPKPTHEQREQADIAKAAPVLTGYAGQVAKTKSAGDLWDVIRANQSGYVGGTSSIATGTELVGVPDEYITWPPEPRKTAMKGQRPTPGDPNPWYPIVTKENFEKLVASGWTPSVSASVQLGVSPDKLTGANAGIADTVRTQIMRLRGLVSLRDALAGAPA